MTEYETFWRYWSVHRHVRDVAPQHFFRLKFLFYADDTVLIVTVVIGFRHKKHLEKIILFVKIPNLVATNTAGNVLKLKILSDLTLTNVSAFTPVNPPTPTPQPPSSGRPHVMWTWNHTYSRSDVILRRECERISDGWNILSWGKRHYTTLLTWQMCKKTSYTQSHSFPRIANMFHKSHFLHNLHKATIKAKVMWWFGLVLFG